LPANIRLAGKHACALAAGGGIDRKVSKSIAIRLAPLDYFMTEFSGRYVTGSGTGAVGSLEINNRNNFQLLPGVNTHIRSKK
jgi:hypothetical protein